MKLPYVLCIRICFKLVSILISLISRMRNLLFRFHESLYVVHAPEKCCNRLTHFRPVTALGANGDCAVTKLDVYVKLHDRKSRLQYVYCLV